MRGACIHGSLVFNEVKVVMLLDDLGKVKAGAILFILEKVGESRTKHRVGCDGGSWFGD
jgi:hypothetical protein